MPAYTYEFLTLEQIRGLIRSESREDWAKASMAVYRLADPGLKKLLLLELVSCKDQQIRRNSLCELKQAAGPAAVPTLQAALREDSAHWIRHECAEMLGALGGEGTVEALLEAVRDPDDRLQLYAAGALSRLGHPGPAADLLASIASQLEDPDGVTRRQAAEDLISLHSSLALPSLLRAVRDPSGEVRATAARGLGSVGGSGVIPVLEGMSGDPVPDVADAAKDALEKLRGPKK